MKEEVGLCWACSRFLQHPPHRGSIKWASWEQPFGSFWGRRLVPAQVSVEWVSMNWPEPYHRDLGPHHLIDKCGTASLNLYYPVCLKMTVPFAARACCRRYGC